MKKMIIIFLLAPALAPILHSKGLITPRIVQDFFLTWCIAVAAVVTVAYFVYESSFREWCIIRFSFLWRTHFMKVWVVFLIGIGVSTLFAIDRSTALWGDPFRSEGLIQLIFVSMYVVLIGIFFEKKEWIRFFKILTVVSVILAVKEMTQVAMGIYRPGSFLDNPALLAAYYICSITAAWFVLEAQPIGKKQSKLWSYVAVISMIASIIGIVYTQTRGAILGIIIATGVVLVYGFVQGRSVYIGKYTVRKVSKVLLAVGVVLCVSFLVVARMGVWNDTSVLSRFSPTALTEGTGASRIRAWNVGVTAILPQQEGIQRTLFGWGPENFIHAFAKYYDPQIYPYDAALFDRAHNKGVDTLVAFGVIGLLLYVTLWIVVYRKVRTISSVWLRGGLYFFGVAYAIQLMFLFDVYITWVYVAVLASYVIFRSRQDSPEPVQIVNISRRTVIVSTGVLIVVAFGIAGSALYSSVIGYVHLKQYSAQRFVGFSHNPHYLSDMKLTAPSDGIVIDDVLEYSTKEFVDKKDAFSAGLLRASIDRAIQYDSNTPRDLRWYPSVIPALLTTGEVSDIAIAREYADRLLAWAPKYPPYQYLSALVLVRAGEKEKALALFTPITIRIDTPEIDYYHANILYLVGGQYYTQSIDLFEKVYRQDPTLATDFIKKDRSIYLDFFKYFYAQKDTARFLMTVRSLERLDSSRAELYKNIENFIIINNRIPTIDIQ